MGIPMSNAGLAEYVPNQSGISRCESDGKIIGLPTPQEMIVYETWAKTANDSQMYRNIGKEAAIMMIILTAREFGIGPAQALNGGVQIIEGKVELSARMMSALIRRAGHKLKIGETSETMCEITGRRKDTGETHTAKFTIEQAQKAGLIKDKGGWKKDPEDMLYARALSRLARRLFSDVIGIGYIQGEISDSRGVSDSSVDIEEYKDNPVSETAFDQLLHQFIPEDRPLAVNFISDVGKHYKWSTELTVKHMSESLEETMIRFNSYKQRFNEKVAHTIEHHSNDSNGDTVVE